MNSLLEVAQQAWVPQQAWIVDDSPLEVETLRRELVRSLDVRAFSRAHDVVAALEEGGRPDILIVDWVMPGMSGIELSQWVRANVPGDLPILLVTAQIGAERVVEGLQAGANDFLGKPFDPAELVARVKALLRSKELLRRAERAEATLRRFLLDLPDAVLAVGGDGRIVLANNEALEMLGLPRERVEGSPFESLLPELPFQTVERAGPATSVLLPDLLRNERVYEPRVGELAMGEGGGDGLLVTFRNVTEKRRADARRLDLYSMAAHDLRSPLTSILMRVDWLLAGRRGPLEAPVQSDISRIERRIRDLVAMINDFLELARLENTPVRLERSSIDLAAVAERAIEEFGPVAQASGISMVLEKPAEGISVIGDRSRLDRVFTNLFSNALKHTPTRGRVSTRMELLPDQRVRVTVEDTGTGIPPELLPSVFERYTRGDARNGAASTGLGLMIVREIVESHGGTVGVRSEPGGGAAFSFVLPTHPVLRARQRRTQMLVVEDDGEFREVLVEFFTGEGFEVRSAGHGLEALNHLGAGYRPDLIVMDLAMPVMSGWQLREILAETPDLAHIPVVVVTGETKVCAKELRAAAVLPKTVSPPAIGDTCMQVLGNLHQRAEAALASAAAH